MEKETITITKERYNELLDSELLLSCLNSGGVDNWDWYGDALDDYRERKENRNG